MSTSKISAHELLEMTQADQSIELIDVRTPAEFRELHVSFAKNRPLERLDIQAIAAERNGSDRALYVICRSGTRGKQACEKLLSSGIENVVNVEGGTQACEKAGLPVVHGKKAMSLDRQVRIVAGAIILTGALLGIFVHPYWSGLAAFVGAGLIFAGITDTCGMAMLLARMPWNQVSDSESCDTTASCCK